MPRPGIRVADRGHPEPVAGDLCAPGIVELMIIHPFCGGTLRERRPEINDLEWVEWGEIGTKQLDMAILQRIVTASEQFEMIFWLRRFRQAVNPYDMSRRQETQQSLIGEAPYSRSALLTH